MRQESSNSIYPIILTIFPFFIVCHSYLSLSYRVAHNLLIYAPSSSKRCIYTPKSVGIVHLLPNCRCSLHQVVEGAFHFLQALFADMGVYLCCTAALMAQQLLDVP